MDAGSRKQRMAVCDGGRVCDGVAVISDTRHHRSDPLQMMEAAHDRGGMMARSSKFKRLGVQKARMSCELNFEVLRIVFD